MRKLARALAALLLLTPALSVLAQEKPGEEIAISVTPFLFAPLESGATRFGRLTFLDAVRLVSEHESFGGFSGLVMSKDGERLVAVSDDGWWLGASLERKDGRIVAVVDARIAPLLGRDGKRPRGKIRRDAEALAPWDGKGIDGRLIVGFESRERVEAYDIGARGFAALPRLIPSPKAISEGPENEELEAVGRFFEGPSAGWFIAISEGNFDPDGNIRGWMWKGSRTVPLKLKRYDTYRVTDLALLPGGREFVTVERSYVPPFSLGMVVRRFAVADLEKGKPGGGEMLLEARWPRQSIDNMEAISARPGPEGGAILSVLSDDNYNRSLQRTILIEFMLAD